MKRFSFRLEPVLRLRKQLQRQRHHAVARIVSQMQAHRQAIARMLATSRAEAMRLRQGYLVGELDVRYLSNFRNYVLGLDLAVRSRLGAISRLQRPLAEARRQLIRARTDAMVMEKLKQRYYQRYARQLQREELTELDELGRNLWARRQSEQPFER